MKTKNMLFRVLPFIAVLCFGCRSASKTAEMQLIGEDNKDVVVLSYLIRDYMRETDNDDFSLSDIIKYDTLGRVINNFSALEVTNWPNVVSGGYIVYFKFSGNRNKDSVRLRESEIIPWVKEREKIGRNNTHPAIEYDGEIHFYYPERLYHIAEIIFYRDS